MKLPFVKTYV